MVGKQAGPDEERPPHDEEILRASVGFYSSTVLPKRWTNLDHGNNSSHEQMMKQQTEQECMLKIMVASMAQCSAV